MEFVDVIFYINLQSRPDRNEHFLKEISKLYQEKTKLIRIDAIYNKNGAIGCTLSHIKALETFMANPEWKTCIIFEDDFTFYTDSLESNTNLLKTFFINFTDWDILLLASNQPRIKPTPTSVPGIMQVNYAQTTSGYCIHKDSVKKIYDNFRESLCLFYSENSKKKFALDIYWNVLSWKRYSFQPNMGYQYANMSDIENRITNYKC